MDRRISVGPYALKPEKQLKIYDNKVTSQKASIDFAADENFAGWKSFDKQGNCTVIQSADSEKDRKDRLKRKLENLKKDLEKKRSKGFKSSLAAAVIEVGEEPEEPVLLVDDSGSSESESSATRSPTPSEEGGGSENQAPPKALEVMCGCAELTSELHKAGFDATGIDYKGCKDKAKSRVIWIDLATRLGQLEFWDLVHAGSVRYIHFAPPCGTASRAREIRRRGVDPKPLRSQEHPDGLPDLCGPSCFFFRHKF